MQPKLDDEAIRAIEAILKRGNNAIVRRNKDCVVIAEEHQKTIYRTTQSSE